MARLDHLGLAVADLAATPAWYTSVSAWKWSSIQVRRSG
jgi:hypothetical protein